MESSELALVIISQDRSVEINSGRIISSLKEKKINATSSLFNSRFATDGTFEKIFQGDKDIMRQLSLEEKIDYLVLGKSSSRVNNQNIFAGQKMFSAEVFISVKIISPKTGFAIREFSVSGKSTGFSPESALIMASESMLDNLQATLLSSVV